jgi:hypothetical protein
MKRNYALNPVAVGLHNNVIYEPQRTNHFEVYLYLPSAIADNNKIKTEEYRKYITLATQNFSLPNISVAPVTIPYGNTMIKLAGQVEYGGADSLECIDYIGADVEGILYAWQQLVANAETGQIGWAYNYKVDAKVLEYSPDGECLSTWILKGVWPSAIAYGGSLDKSSSDIKRVQVTISYDLGYRKFGTSTRNKAKQAAANAMSNMTWKDSYEDDNAGGPITPINDQM